VETLRIAVALPSINKVPSSGYGSEIMVYNLALGFTTGATRFTCTAPT